MVRFARLLVIAGVACGLLPAAASAHGGGNADYRSRVERITPDGLPITAVVEDNDDRLRVTWRGEDEIVIRGYVDEPYVRIGPDGVFVNENSAAYFANEERYGAKVPEGIGDGPPKWVRQPGDEPTFEFHDHRIHWMLPSPPKQVDREDPRVQPVFDWQVPFSVAGTPGAIEGSLDFIGGEEPSAIEPWMLVAGGVAGFLVLDAVVIYFVFRRRRTRR